MQRCFHVPKGGSNNLVETALALQKNQFEEIINAQTLQLREATEYWEQQMMQWDATIFQLEEQGERSQSELHDHYQFELRQVHRAMDAAIVEARSQAATFIRTGIQKLKDMETERDKMIKQAVTTALEQQKMEFDAIINSQELLLKEANSRLEQQQILMDLEAKRGTQSVPGTRDPILGDVGTDLDQIIRQAVEVALKQQKVEFEAIISAHESKLQEVTEYWEQQKIQWDASMIQLAEQGERSQSELHDHYQYELRQVHRAMDAAIVEAQSEATTFVRTGKQKLKDMETERDEMITQAVTTALEQQKMEFDEIINSQELLLKEANSRLEQQQILMDPKLETERDHMIHQSIEVAVSQQKAEFEAKMSAHESKLREITEYWEQQKIQWDASMIELEEQGKRSQSELHDHYQYELRQVHRAMDAAIVEAQSEAVTFVRAGMQKIKDMETERDEMIMKAAAAALEQQQTFCTQKSQLQEASMLREQQNGHCKGSTISLEEQGKRSQSEPQNPDQCELREMHRGMDVAMFDAPLAASTFVRRGIQGLTDKEEPKPRFQDPKRHFQGNHPREKEQKQQALFFGDAIELQDLSHKNKTEA
ncbi:hypothetical protein MHU86_14347 [Fragilaria crotonensis]|nr:hypothetical protein MHU86_14347 [Fragilaria crotonensis]